MTPPPPVLVWRSFAKLYCSAYGHISGQTGAAAFAGSATLSLALLISVLAAL
ncbi:hypothetical protein [Streptomyces sp. NPDC001410]|uniref:hypothetical protein n=1 Tax=Streptomyces sp. NPDC001410 TaxID=3364574 RepID=UPI0036BBA9D5